MIFARSVMRSIGALQSRALGITWVHSENGRLVVMITAAFLGPFGDDLEQELRADLGQRYVADFIERAQIVTRPARQGATELQLMLGLDHLVDQRGGGGEAHPALLSASGDGQAGQQMGLAGASVPYEDDRLCFRDVVALGKFMHLWGETLGLRANS